jgi:AcrR family transcriptional regulator
MANQETKSERMRQRLVNATLNVLMESGYHHTSTTEIVRRAKVSRGALSHHFKCKADLIAAASEQMLEEATHEIEELASKLISTDLTLYAFLDRLWDKFSGRLFFITLEYVAAARTDKELQAKLVPVVKKFHRSLDTIWRRFFRQTRMDDTQVEMVLNMTLCLLRGMGVQTILRQDPEYYSNMISAWKKLLAQITEVQSVHKPNEDLCDQKAGIMNIPTPLGLE